MSKTAMIRARTEPELKQDVERIFHALGLSPTAAINLFFRQVKLCHGLPFNVELPNKTTLKALKAVEEKRGLVRCKDTKGLFKKLGL